MRLAALTLFAFVLSVPVVWADDTPAGSLSVENGRGSVRITGKDALLGKIEKGSLSIVDLTPNDQWSPWVNGVPRGKVVWLRGKKISFRVSGGRYKIIARGTGISVSARGVGQAILDGDPDAVGDTGLYSIGDGPQQPLPEDAFRLLFGTPDPAASSGSGRISP